MTVKTDSPDVQAGRPTAKRRPKATSSAIEPESSSPRVVGARSGSCDKSAAPDVAPSHLVRESDIVASRASLELRGATRAQIYKHISDQCESQDAELKNVLFGAMLNDPAVAAQCAMGYLDDVRNKIQNDGTKKTIRIPYVLSSEDKILLRSTFPRYRLDFDDAIIAHPHPAAAATRKICEIELNRLIHFDSLTSPDSGYDVAVKFIGGNPSHHVKGGYAFSHTCSPVLDYNDALRAARFQYEINSGNLFRTTDLSSREVLRKMFDSDSKTMCRTVSQKCPVTAPAMVALHSLYDMSLRDIAAAMDMARAQILVAVLQFDPMIFLHANGRIPFQGSRYVVEPRDGKKTIRFYFPEDSQCHYVHDYKTYIALFRKHYIQTKNALFLISVDLVRSPEGKSLGLAYVTIHRATCLSVPKSVAIRSYPIDREVYILKMYALLDHSDSTGKPMTVRILVDVKLWHEIWSYAASLRDSNFSEKAIHTALLSLNQRAIDSGGGFTSREKMSVLDLRYVSLAVYIGVYIENYMSTQTEVRMKKQIESLREGEYSFLTFLRAVFKRDSWRQLLGIRHNHHDQSYRSIVKSEVKCNDVSKDISEASDDPFSQTTCKHLHNLKEIMSSVGTKKKFLPYLRMFPNVLTVEQEVQDMFTEEPLTDILWDFDAKHYLPLFASVDGPEPPKPISSNYECSADLKVKEVDGQGDCLLDALRVAGADLPPSFRVREEILERFDDSLTESQKKSLRARAGSIASWLDVSICKHLAMMYDLRICVHFDTSQGVQYGDGQLVHILVRGSHADALVDSAELCVCPTFSLADQYESSGVTLAMRDALIPNGSLFADTTFRKKDYKIAVNNADKYSALKDGGYVCRSGLKIAEIIHRFDIPTPEVAVLDIGGGPGGFAQYFLRSSDATVFGITKRATLEDDTDYAYDKSLNNYQQFIRMTGDGFCDLNRDEFVESILRSFECFQEQIEIVCADCSLGYDGGPETVRKKISRNDELTRRQWRIASKTLKTGGTFIMKVADVGRAEPADLLIDIASHFTSVSLVKPHTSRPASREVFLVARGYRLGSVTTSRENIEAIASHILSLECQALRQVITCYLTLNRPNPCRIEVSESVLRVYKRLLSLPVINAVVGAVSNEVQYSETDLVDFFESWKRIASQKCRSSDPDIPVSEGLDETDYAPQPVRENLECAMLVPPERSCTRRKNLKFSASDLILHPVESFKKRRQLRQLRDSKSIPKVRSLPVPDSFVDIAQYTRSVLSASVKSNRSAACNSGDRLQKLQDLVDEYVLYLKALERSRLDHFKLLCDRDAFVRGSQNQSVFRELEGFRALKKGVTELKHRYAYDVSKGKFSKMEDVPNGTDIAVSDDTLLMVDYDILDELTKRAVVVSSDLDIKFIQAGPGCGKTFWLVHEYVDNPSSIMVVSTCEGKKDVEEKLTKLGIEHVNVRTIHSMLGNAPVRYERMWIDEALMQHPGMIVAAIVRSRATDVSVVGDVMQIPFVNRNPDFFIQSPSLSELFPVTHTLNVSYRCPADVIARLSPYYLEGLKSKRFSYKSVSLQRIDSIQDVPRDTTHQYLTYTQREKIELARYGLNVSTVHEYQGKEAPVVVVVRLVPAAQRVPIFDDKAYAIVAISRHTESCVYYTTSTEDALSKLIANEPDSAEVLEAYVGPTVGAITDYTIERDSYRAPVARVALPSSALRIVPKLDAKKPVLEISRARLRDIKNRIARLGDEEFQVVLREKNFAEPILARIAGVAPKATLLRPEFPILHPRVAELMNRNAILDAPGFSEPERPIPTREPLADLQPIIPLIQDLQNAANTLFPTSSCVDTFLDAWRVSRSMPNRSLKGTSFCTFKGTWAPKKFDTLEPVLRTQAPRIRDNNLTEILLAYAKRNAAVPQLTSVVATRLVSERMFRRFRDAYFRDGIDTPRFEEIHLNSVDIEEWLRSQPTNVSDVIDPVDISNIDISRYEFIIKRAPKPNLTDAAYKEYQSLQTVLFQPKAINALFCTFFKIIKKRLKAVLKDNIFIFTDVDPTDFSELLTQNVSLDSVRSDDFLEIDISKYDKSQGQLALEFEMLFMRFFGVPEKYLRVWYRSHAISRFFERSVGFKGTLFFQRRSGDAATFLGNTVYLMGVLADSLHYKKITMAMFSGDDSLIFGSEVSRQDLVSRLALLYNLEIKILKFKYPYFCSKFLLFGKDRIHFVPDPVKLLVKLGRHDLRNWDHVEEYRRSVEDTTIQYRCREVIDHLALSVKDRYHFPHDPSLFLKSLAFISSEEVFPKLYREYPGIRMLHDPSVVDYD